MFESLSGRQPLLGLEEEEWGEEADAVTVQPGGLHHQGLARVGGELVAGELLRPRYTRPVVLCGGAQHLQQHDMNGQLIGGRAGHLEDKMKLILHRGAWEERSARGHLVENAANPPHINGGGVLGGAKQDVGRPVPQGHHLVAVGLGRDRLGPR